MIRMIQSASAGHAKSYFSQALAKSDYYLDDQELQGRFLGRLADRIGISGTATKDGFFALCENMHPLTGERLTPRKKEDRTVGYDINFHAPKSVSLIHVLSKDSHIMGAFTDSVRETMQEIENDSMARVRKNNKSEDRKTGELAWAEFTHQTARPVEDALPDPHLHTHCFVFNATYDGDERKIKAAQFRQIKQDMPFYQAMFHKKFSDKLIELGYQVRRTEKSFEIVGVPKEVIELFSKRTNEIGEFAKRQGITDAKELDKLGAMTRSKKQKGHSMDELKAAWRGQIVEANLHGTGTEKNSPIRYAAAINRQPAKETAQDCIDHAMQHAFERASVVPDRRLLATAYRHSIGKGSVKLEEITKAFRDDRQIIHVSEKGRVFCTTKAVLSEEQRMVGLARSGVGKFQPLYNHAPELKLIGQQAEAARHLLTTRNQVSIVRGAAGAGKTTMMQETVKLIERAGKQVTVVAPTAQASRGVLAGEGFADATTVARLLVDKQLQDQLEGQVLWVDEAGLLGTKDMADILALAKKQHARLILGGDTRQHSSVVRGDALRILNTVGGIKTAEISRIWRQKNFHYREAVEQLFKGNVKDAFAKLDGMGAIKTIDPLKPNETLVEDYTKAAKQGKSVLVVSPTRSQGEAVTEALRTRLRSEGLLGKKERQISKLKNLNLTVAEKSDLRNIGQGQVVQFNQNVANIKRGSVWSVKEIINKEVLIQNDAGEQQFLPLTKPTAFDLYQKTLISLSKGDKVRITRNSFDKQDKRLDNGTALEVVSARKSGEITLVNRSSKAIYKLDKAFGHIDHAYCSTSHSAQGKTVDKVLISQPASTFNATDAKQFYVSVSRGRDAATIYTDDKEALLHHAAEMGDRQSAMELVGGKDKHLDHVMQKQREEYSKNITPIKTTSKETVTHSPRVDRDYELGI